LGKALRSQGRALGLRLRLTLIYAAFLALIVVALGFLFRQTLEKSLEENASAILSEEWAAVKGYLRVEKGKANWYYDVEDPEETAIVQRLRSVFLLADKSGKVIEMSKDYPSLGAESTKEIERILKLGKAEERVRRDADGYLYLVRSGLHVDDGRKEFLLSIGRSLDADEAVVQAFTGKYFSLAPLIILGISVISWWMAGRALEPLNVVAQAARSITGENLNLSLPRRGANDELDHLIDAFNNMVDRLEDSFNQIRQFSIDVSHELRTPLTAVRGQLEVALFTAKTPEQYQEAIAAAIEDVDQLSQVVRALLHLSQAESGQVTLAREPVDLARLVASVVEQFQVPAELAGVTLVASAEAGTPVQGDRVQIERLVSNLLSNALKYTPSGGRVTARVQQLGHETELVVEDTGRGIPPEHLPHIFDRFYRVPDGNRNPERGLGLGLSFVAWIVKAHGAKIHVDSTPGLGSRFTVMFTADQIAASAFQPLGDRVGV
jgi:heavy metal sensor kinase